MGNKIVPPQELRVELLHKQLIQEHGRQRANGWADFRLFLVNDLPRRLVLLAAVASAQTGLLTNQKVKRGTTTLTPLLNLSYDYLRAGTTSGRTGQLTEITNNLDGGRDRAYEYDALGRLKKATGGTPVLWTQNYGYDRYGNRTSVTKTGTADDGSPIESDGFALLAFSATSNRITTAGWTYDAAGNLIRAQRPGGAWQRYQYDAAGRLVKVKTDDLLTEIVSYSYGSSNERLMAQEGSLRTYYARSGSAVLAEYTEANTSGVLQWDKNYVYLGERLLATQQRNGTTESIQYYHSDRLGTRLITNASDTSVQEQVTLPYGVALSGETSGATNRRFTSYERNAATGLDYAVNRHYDSLQGRFTQVDPLGTGAASLNDPQSLNLYAYCGNDPVNLTDPSGLDYITDMFDSAWFSFHGFNAAYSQPFSYYGRGPLFIDYHIHMWRFRHVEGPDEYEIGIDAFFWGQGTGGFMFFGGPQGTDSKDSWQDDCLSLAAIIDRIAGFESANDDQFIGQVAKTLIAPDANEGGPRYRMHTSRGFKPEFREPLNIDGSRIEGGSPNQVHHYAGTMVAGYLAGYVGEAAGLPYKTVLNIALLGSKKHEGNTPPQSAKPDNALNEVSVRHGVDLAYGRIHRAQIGSLIRRDVCGPQ